MGLSKVLIVLTVDSWHDVLGSSEVRHPVKAYQLVTTSGSIKRTPEAEYQKLRLSFDSGRDCHSGVAPESEISVAASIIVRPYAGLPFKP